MAKTYLDMVKYMVEAKFTIGGMVDKPDIIGAVFGQTEGLLGDELDLRELQKGGKIGRIEIELQQSNNKSFGKLLLPASLDRIETCILAAAVESVDRVGPYEASFSVAKVEDTRSEKRRKILIRAKDLVKLLLNTEIPDSKELSEMVQSEVRTSEITTYGPEKLPAGPEVGKTPDLVLVEGRADVLNLLKNDITNVLAIGGATSIPKSIIDLCREKEVIAFLDGDRGGDMILRSLSNVTDIDFVARAPDGKEVEDLTRKEIIKAMRTRVPLDQYLGTGGRVGRQQQQYNREQNRQQESPRRPQQEKQRYQRQEVPNYPQERPERQEQKPQEQVQEQGSSLADLDNESPSRPSEDNESFSPTGLKSIESDQEDETAPIEKIESERVRGEPKDQGPKPALESIALTTYSSGLDELSGTLRSRLYDHTGNILKEIPIRELLTFLQGSSGVYAVVLDGVITQRLVELSLQKGIKAIYGLRANPMPKKHTDIFLYTKEQ